MSTPRTHAVRPTLPLFDAPGEWNGLLKMAPAALDLVQPVNAAHQGLELIANAANRSRFVSILTSMQALLRDARIPVLVDGKRGGPDLVAPDRLTRPQRRWLGQIALELYFTQLLRNEVAILDLWPSRFGMNASGDAVWNPRPFYLRWDPEFREGLCNVYAGLFLDQNERLGAGLRQLRLGSSAHRLVQHLGEGHPRSVRFAPSKLESTLKAISDDRPPEHEALHRNFLAFGLYVTSLHQLLGSLEMAFDVRSAFMRSQAER